MVVDAQPPERLLERWSVLAGGRDVDPRIATPPDAAERPIAPDDFGPMGVSVHAPIGCHIGQFPGRQEAITGAPFDHNMLS
ncbi:hypothetical protein ACLBQC_31215 [Klebsiella pneumoniae]|uniref:hypothetical protein n=1 Tax=Klebsiella pneumoniae TaxID=573 RepID=UPI0039695A47